MPPKAKKKSNDPPPPPPPRKRGRPSKKAERLSNKDPPICDDSNASTSVVSTNDNLSLVSTCQVKVSTSDGKAAKTMTSTLLSPTKIVITTAATTSSRVQQPTPKNVRLGKKKIIEERAETRPRSNVIVISDDDEQSSCDIDTNQQPVAGTSATKTGHVMTSNEDDGDVCPICLDKPVHPVKLECGHEFCYLCAKGLTSSDEEDDNQNYVTQYGPGGVVIQIPIPRAARGHGGTPVGSCSMCRAPIKRGYLKRPEILTRTRADLEGATRGSVQNNQCQWFYEGRNGGWWKFEERHNEEIEEAFTKNPSGQLETMICGHIYVVDFSKMIQYRKDTFGRRRKIKRDFTLAHCKGVAGLFAARD